MDVKQEIAKHVETLPPQLQERVLEFITSLPPCPIVGEHGTSLRKFSSSLDHVSAQQMMQAIDEECERVDVPA